MSSLGLIVKKLVDALYGSINSVSWIDKSLLLACCGLLNNLYNVSVQYVGRVQNKAADTLAKSARSYVSSMKWWYTPPAFIKFLFRMSL